jgi:hypothetical protein
MATNELVYVYEMARRRAARLRLWPLRWWAWRVRRARRRERTNEVHQVRLVAIEHELVVRGALARPTFPGRPGPTRSAHRWRRRGR